jgi:glycosyltransferase involved in cell wall biosynthesis
VNSPAFTLLICTHDRPEDLRITLEAIGRMHLPKSVAWEIVVVDNASGPPTRAVCDAFGGRLPIRYVREEIPGKSRALDRGIRAAAGALIAQTDDDVTVDSRWAERLLAAANAHPGCGFFGGPVLGLPGNPMPRWMADNMDWLRCHPRLDRGPAPVAVRDAADVFLIGANIAYRRDLAARVGHNPDLGPRGNDRAGVGGVGGEERELQRGLIALGFPGLYLPEARVYHRDPAHRMTERFVRQWYYRSGHTEALHGIEPACPPLLFGAPRHLWRAVLGQAARYLLARPLGSSRTWLRCEADAATALGQIRGFREALRRRKRMH